MMMVRFKVWASVSTIRFYCTCYFKNSSVVGSTDRASSQQLQIWFSEHFFAPELAALFVTPIVSLRWNNYGTKKCLKNHIPFNF